MCDFSPVRRVVFGAPGRGRSAVVAGVLLSLTLAAAAPAWAQAPRTGIGARAGAAPAGATSTVWPAPASGQWELTGHGWGHGIGMSQYGALGAAKAGLSPAQIVAFYYPGTSLAVSTLPAPRTVRVRLETDTDGVTDVLAAAGLAVSVDGGAPVVLPGAGTGWHVRAVSASVAELVGDGAETPPEVRTGARFTFTASTAVPVLLPNGNVRGYDAPVVADAGPTVTSTVYVPVETYLRDVVPQEMPAYFPAAALGAQAIAARTYALKRVPGAGTFDLCDTTRCQVYAGAWQKVSPTAVQTSWRAASTDAAVSATAGQVLSHAGTLADTMFSSSSGGQTVSGGKAYLKAQLDPYDADPGNPLHTWSATLPVATVRAAVPSMATLTSLTVTRDGSGSPGRIVSVLISGRTASGATVSATLTGSKFVDLRRWPAISGGLRSTQLEDPAMTSRTVLTRKAGTPRRSVATMFARR